MGMFRVAERPQMMPGQTMRGSTTGPVVDLGLLPSGGCVYLSRTELHEAARLMPDVVEEIAAEIGWLAPDEADKLYEVIEHLQGDLTEAKAAAPRVVSLDDVRELISQPGPVPSAA